MASRSPVSDNIGRVGVGSRRDQALRTGELDVTVAQYRNAEDKRRGYLRSAHVRVIGPTNTDFGIYKKMRGDSESLNRVIEDSSYRNHRAHSDGAACQEVDMLGLAGLINALTRERMRRARLAQAALIYPPQTAGLDHTSRVRHRADLNGSKRLLSV